MRIDVIESNADFEKIRENWDCVYSGDPHAQYFLSWEWLYGYLHRRDRWFILALREKPEGSPYVAFFPLRMATTQDQKTGICTDDIIMAGNHAADYTGILCDPAYEAHAVRGFAQFLRAQSWTHLRLDNFSGPIERHDAFVQALRGPDIGHKRVTRLDNRNIDHAVCPVVTLPDSWEAYLETKLSGQTRQKLRRFLRQIESDDAYRITIATSETIERDLDALFKLWHAKWHAEKGERIEPIMACAREVLLDAFRHGNLFLPVLWHGDRPLGAIANMLDRKKKAVLFYIAGRDEEWKTPSPGLVLHGYAIRHAISQGYRSYDFLRGNETYKYAFGVEDRPLHCSTLRTATGRNRSETLNVRSIRYVYDLARRLYTEGKKGLAEAAFEQVVAASPAHVGARMALAQLLLDKGRLSDAEAAYQNILAAATDIGPVLLRLGDTQVALKKFHEAAATYDRAIEMQPNSSAAHFSKGVALVAIGRNAEAAKAFEVLEQLNSDDPAHASFQQKAKDVLARLAPTLSPPLELPPIHPSGFPLEAGSLAERFTRDFGRKLMTSATDSFKGFDIPKPAQPRAPPSVPAMVKWQSLAARTKH
ncbi:GNAT family N-acetyltransferase [Rhizobium tubonense]|uniref:Cellulose biosynthesis protein n=1 Tax=Rhizobium tubonense TaxID=484088 RepID=A0A2W4E5G3_9HYPH|nr:GNAT family N-acetyltransferase [Rhizobium tubonense]PZM10746.1 cellulose biosynthesis protein [Rhizobium tubonense]